MPPKDLPAGSTRVGHDDWIVQGLDIRHGHVTQPLIWEELLDFGVDISSGQVSRILTEQKDAFHLKKDGLLAAGLEVSGHINVDDTGARHAGNNTDKQLASKADRERYLEQLGITKDRHIRIATEGALLGSVLHHGFPKELVILSDDAGQFNIMLHALCWIHAARTIHKLISCSEEERKVIEDIRDRIWLLYRDLKAYKEMPEEGTKLTLEKCCDDIFATETCSEELNAALRRVARNKEELLLVLDRPDIPLHNNLGERDIREYVKNRKISGSTRSDNGRRCRDTFTSLKKTCRKLGVSFWEYLQDRISHTGEIPPLPDLVRARARSD